MKRTSGALLLAIAASVLAACSNGGDSLAVSDLRRLVLQPADLAGFQRFDEGRQALSDTRPGERSYPGRFGREGGWKARYRRSGSTTRGALVVESRIELFGDEDGAREELGAASREHRAAVRRAGGAGRMLQPEIGDDAVGFTVVEQALKDVRTFRVEWRQGRVTASITANGFDKRLKLEDVLALAHKQARRIDAER